MTAVTKPRGDVPLCWVMVNGVRTPAIAHEEWDRFLSAMLERVGGVVGAGTTDLSIAQFDDAGISEMQAHIYGLTDEVRGAPPAAVEQDVLRPVAFVAVDTTLDDGYQTVIVTAGAKTITLPLAARCKVGRTWTIAMGAAGYTDIACAGSDVVVVDNGQTRLRLDQYGASISLRCLSTTQWGIA